MSQGTPEERDEIFESLREMVAQVLGEGAAAMLRIEPDSSFTEDLEMESIEIVEFAEKVKARYGERVDLMGWLSGMELDRIIRLRLGDVAAHIRTCPS